MVGISPRCTECDASRCLKQILENGGIITRASDQISDMLNGIKYYSVEVTLGHNSYHIQAYHNEAIDLFVTTMSAIDEKNIMVAKNENNHLKSKSGV